MQGFHLYIVTDVTECILIKYIAPMSGVGYLEASSLRTLTSQNAHCRYIVNKLHVLQLLKVIM